MPELTEQASGMPWASVLPHVQLQRGCQIGAVDGFKTRALTQRDTVAPAVDRRARQICRVHVVAGACPLVQTTFPFETVIAHAPPLLRQEALRAPG